jgi:hypothetical protein
MTNNKKHNIYTISITLVSKLQHCNKLGLLRCILFKGFHTSRWLATIPVKVYENADTQKADILKENKGKSGVYRWTNNVNGKTYVGSAVSLRARFYVYYSANRLTKSKMPIYMAILKYGYSNFTLDILEYCEPSDLLAPSPPNPRGGWGGRGWEQYYLDLLKPGYNLLSKAGSSLGFKHSEETLTKLRARQHSVETKRKMSFSHGFSHPPAHTCVGWGLGGTESFSPPPQMPPVYLVGD